MIFKARLVFIALLFSLTYDRISPKISGRSLPMPAFTHQQKIRLAILDNLILPLAGLSTNIYLPSLPAMSHIFGVEKYWVQLTITVYAFGLALLVLCMVVASAVVMLIVTTIGYYNLIVLVAPIYIMILFCGMIFPIYVPECLNMFPTMAASANGVLFASTWLSFSIFTAIGVLLKLRSLIPLAFAYSMTGLLQLAVYTVQIKKHHTAG